VPFLGSLFFPGGGVLLALLVGISARGQRRNSALASVVVGAVGFQVFHFFEHALQVRYWVLNPQKKPWFTPWAQTGVDGLAYWCQLWPGKGAAGQRGAELLHLIGNGIFLSGIVVMFVLTRIKSVQQQLVNVALLLQGLHFIEHTILTLTVFVSGTGWGASTMFGRWSGTELSSHRFWWHFTINGIATAIALVALLAIYRSGALTGRKPKIRRADQKPWSRYVIASIAGMALLQSLPFAVGSLVGNPAPRKIRNVGLADIQTALSDIIDPGEWWHLADPYVLLPLLLLGGTWRLQNRIAAD
jgi:hypothetical protein